MSLLALPTLIPVLAVLIGGLGADAELLEHLRHYVLPRVALNTLWLLIGVTLLAGILGTGLAWLVAVYEFPGRRWLAPALMLPMAVPGYVMGFVYIGLFEFAGPLQTGLRELFGAQFRLPPIRSTGGVILVLALTLYPYVYLIARGAFANQGRRALEVGQGLGLGRKKAFLRVALPLARPAIAGGMLLVAMETLADFGTVAVFNYDSFTTAIYQAWFSMFSIQSAMHLAGYLVVLALLLIVGEQALRGRARYAPTANAPLRRIPLRGAGAAAACGLALAVLGVAFVLPFSQLLLWAWQSLGAQFTAGYGRLTLNSLLLAGGAALLIAGAALALGYLRRVRGDRAARALARVATLGYALPGPVLAVGIFAPLAALSGVLTGLMPGGWGVITLQSTLLTLMLAYLARFLAVGFAPVQAGMARITPSLDEAATGMGLGALQRLLRLHLPLLRGGLLTAMALIFVDVMKEMPITLMTRPYGWDTLAVQIYELTAEGRWQQAALPGVLLVVVGLVPLWLLVRKSEADHGA